MGRVIGKIVYIIVAIFFVFVMIKGGMQTSKKTLQYIKDNMVVCESGKLLEENEGKLVLVYGDVTVDEKSLSDEEFDVEVENVIFLNRIAYQYRWYTYQDEEKYKTYEEDSNGKRVEVEKTRTVTKLTNGWQIADDKKAENVYFNKADHINPNSRMTSLYQMATVHLGDFILDENSLALTNFSHKFQFYNDLVDGSHPVMGKYHKEVDNKNKSYITTGNQIGDYKVEFCYLKASDVGILTVVGKQVGNKIEPYNENNVDLFETYHEIVPKNEIIKRIQKEYNNAKIGMVVVAIILIVVGVFVFGEEIGNVADKVKNNKKKKSVNNI